MTHIEDYMNAECEAIRTSMEPGTELKWAVARIPVGIAVMTLWDFWDMVVRFFREAFWCMVAAACILLLKSALALDKGVRKFRHEEGK